MTTRDALGREFIERKANIRQVVPVSIGDADGNGIPEVAMTYGEVAPQVYRSRVATSQVAWSIVFGQHRHVSTQEAARGLAFVAGRKPDPVHHGRTSAKARHLGGGHNYLVIWIPTDQLSQTRILNGGLGTVDMIGENPPLLRRVINWVSGQ